MHYLKYESLINLEQVRQALQAEDGTEVSLAHNYLFISLYRQSDISSGCTEPYCSPLRSRKRTML